VALAKPTMRYTTVSDTVEANNVDGSSTLRGWSTSCTRFYFNNDAGGHAPRNGLTLRRDLEETI